MHLIISKLQSPNMPTNARKRAPDISPCFECCGGLNNLGSCGCRARHWPACIRTRAAAGGDELSTETRLRYRRARCSAGRLREVGRTSREGSRQRWDTKRFLGVFARTVQVGVAAGLAWGEVGKSQAPAATPASAETVA